MDVVLDAFIGLISVTFFYEGIEGLIEKFIFKQKVRFRWAPQAIFFALISTLAFVYLNMPIGFIFGFIASSYILNSRPNAKLSPKFYSSISLSAVGFGFFYLTSLPFILESTVFTAIAAISYLMCIEGVLLKALPGGGNELLESLNDLIDSADDKTKAKFYYLSGLANYQNGESSFENKLSSIENFNNAKEIVSLSNVDGALIGGASLKSDDFTKIIAD